jgi:hypothetical protein
LKIERPHWKLTRDALCLYDRARVESRLCEWIDEFMPRAQVPLKGKPELPELALYQRRIDLLLSRMLPPWYGHDGWRIAQESFGGCMCHSFLNEYVSENRVDGVARGAAWVCTEVDALLGCLREFDQLFAMFEFSHDPGDRAASVATVIDQVFSIVGERTNYNGAWQRYVIDGVRWLFDGLALDAPPVLVALVETTVNGLSDACVAPPLAERYRLSQDLGVIVAHATLDTAR